MTSPIRSHSCANISLRAYLVDLILFYFCLSCISKASYQGGELPTFLISAERISLLACNAIFVSPFPPAVSRNFALVVPLPFAPASASGHGETGAKVAFFSNWSRISIVNLLLLPFPSLLWGGSGKEVGIREGWNFKEPHPKNSPWVCCRRLD